MKMKPEDRWNVQCQGETKQAKCKSLTENIHAAQVHAIMYFKNYVKDYERCTNTIEALRNSIRCASCDSNNMYLINDQHKVVYLNKNSMNKVIKSCYNYAMYRFNLIKDLYTAFLNYAKQVDPTVSIQTSEFDGMFNPTVEGCANWLKFTRTDYSGDLTRSRECISFGLSLIKYVIPDSKNLTFEPIYWRYINEITNTLMHTKIKDRFQKYLPSKMRPDQKNRILEDDLTPQQKEMIKKEDQSDKGFKVDIKDVKTEWKFLVHPDPKKGLDLAIYDKFSGLKTINIEQMFKNKEIAGDISTLMKKSDKYYKKVFGKDINESNE